MTFNVSRILEFCFQNNELDRITDVYSHILSPTKVSATSNARDVIPQLLAFLILRPNMSIHFAHLCPWNMLPPVITLTLNSSIPNILNAFVNHSHVAGDLIIGPFHSVLAEASYFTLGSFRNLAENITLAVRSPELAMELFLQVLEPMSASLLEQSSQATQYFIKHIFGAALDHIEEATEQSSPGQELWHLRAVTFKIERAKLKSERRIDAPRLERLSAGDHVRFSMANAPLNAPLLPPASFDALVEMSQPGEVTFRCVQHPPAYVEKCAWKMKHCGSAVTTMAMIDATLKLVTEKQTCCELFDSLANEIPQQENPMLSGSTIGFRSGDLNERQNAAVWTCLNNPLTCLWGPPGTGKTHTIVRLLQALLTNYPDDRILVTAPTHNATDNVLQKYIDGCERDGISARGPIRVSTDVSVFIFLPRVTINH